MANVLRPACVSVLVLTACLVLPACGNKGPLVRALPMVEEAWTDDAPPAEDLPPTTEPTEPDRPAEIAPPPAADPPSDPAPVSGDGDGDG